VDRFHETNRGPHPKGGRGNKLGAREFSYGREASKVRGQVLRAADEYRRHASECVRLAQSAHTSGDKALLLRMAESWLRLAEQVEKREQKKPQ
jgi:hypothetical protein